MKGKTEKPNKALTDRQAQILSFIQDFIIKNKVPPTHKEIASAFELKGTYGIRQHLQLMEKKGILQLIPGKARGIRLTSPIPVESEEEIAAIPLLGRIAAGQPILAVENVEDHLHISARVFRGKHLFALRVQGDSMRNAGIRPGDIAVFNQQPQVDNGEIAAVLLDDDATLKRVQRESDGIRLKAENASYNDIVIPPDTRRRFRIIGRLVGLLRQDPMISCRNRELS